MNTKTKNRKLKNPYRGKTGTWHRGNFHTHCRENSPCGTIPLDQVVKQYHDIGAAFLAMSDHDTVTDLQPFKTAYPDMIFFEGFEFSQREHTLFIGESVPPLYELPLEDAILRARDLLTILCHPQPRPNQDYWSKSKILALPRLPDGMEIYDGHYGVEIKRAEGMSPQYTRAWDQFLTAGIRLWGFASDDFHDPEDFNNAYNMVLVDDPTPANVLHAVKQGAFYATTGLLLESITESNSTVQITLETKSTGRFIGPHGQLLAEETARDFEYTVTDEPYVRFEAQNDHAKLFLQPIF